ncbi:MAG: tetratricopeptide repeat protein [Bacteroidales bacterium]|nr:tetratricopeptide repeat protein [Bacteroidales bacterium]
MRHIHFIALFLASLLLAGNAFGQQVDVRKNAISFSKGLECKYKDDVQGAVENFEKALRYMPDDAASMFELSEQYVKQNRVDDAFSMIKKASEIDPDNKWYQIRLAQFYRNLEQYDDFIQVYEALTAKYPEDIDMLSELIDIYLITESYNEALDKLDLLEKQVGHNEIISEQRVEIYRRQGKEKNVISELRNLIDTHPEDTRYYNMLAKFYMDKGKEAEAAELYEQIKTIDPNDPYINVALLEYYEKQGQLDKAFEELIAAINNKNLDFNTKANIYEYWFNKFQNGKDIDQQALEAGQAFIENYPDNKFGYVIIASYYLNKEDYRNCRSMSLKALTYDPSNYAALQYLVLCDGPLMEYDSMMKHSTQALQYYPTQPIFYWFAGVSHALDKQDEKAISYFEKGRKFVTEKSLLADFDSYLGDLYHSVGETEKAFDAYDRVLRTDPDNALVLNNYAYYLSLRADSLDKAKEMSLHAVELDPNNAIYLDTYAWVLYKRGEYVAAEAQMKKSLNQLKDPDGTYLEHYGDILFKLGKENEALKYWEKAMKKENHSPSLEKKIKDKRLYD